MEESKTPVDAQTDNSKQVQLTHDELIKLTKGAIAKLIKSDPLFSGLPSDATLEEIKAQVAVAQGQAITLYLKRGLLPKLSIVVPSNNTTVLDLKKAIMTQTNLALHREEVRKKISWRCVWKTYHIASSDIVLNDDGEKIKNYGVCNKTELHYVKRRREKNRVLRTL